MYDIWHISPHPPPARNEHLNLATRPTTTTASRRIQDSFTLILLSVSSSFFIQPALGCYRVSEAGEAVSISQSRYSRCVRLHIRTTSQEAIMGRGKMDEAAAARIRKARGEKVR